MEINVENNTTALAEEITTKEVTNNANGGKLFYRLIKRIMDVIGGIVGCLFLIPITFVLYIANLISKDNKGPLFYEQLRIGKNGKQFRIYKYRSMVMNADEKLWEYLNNNPEAKEEYTKYKKLKNDPRITRIGKFIRKTSIDEFPQFINVLKGDMSLVGPRPYLHREIQDMGEGYNEIIKVKPGLTGPWQTAGRSSVTFEDRVSMDTEYVKTYSLINDAKFLFKTFAKLFNNGDAM